MSLAQAIFAILASIAALAGAFGVAYAVFTSARVRQTIELYKVENEAQGKRIATLESEVKTLLAQNEGLRYMATGQAAIDGFVTVFTRMMDDLNGKVDLLLERSGVGR